MQRRRLLLHIPGCPFCSNAEEALIKAGITFEKLEVDRYDRSIVQALSGQKTVPILVDVYGSQNQDDDIIEAIGAGVL
jgi:glutaredoxin